MEVDGLEGTTTNGGRQCGYGAGMREFVSLGSVNRKPVVFWGPGDDL